MIFSLDNQKWKDILTFAINIYNCYSLFPITWLNYFTSTTLICTGNNHCNINYTYHKTGFVEVIEVVI